MVEPGGNSADHRGRSRQNPGRNEQAQHEQRGAEHPAHPLARPRAYLGHDELLALAHFAVGFQEGGDARDAEVVERLAFGAVAPFPLVQLFRLAPVAFGIGAGIREGCLLGGGEIECSQLRQRVFGKIDQRLVGARGGRQLDRGGGESRGDDPARGRHRNVRRARRSPRRNG